MTDYAALLLPDRDQPARLVHVVDAAGFDAWLGGQSARVRAAVSAGRFSGKAGELVVLPGDAPEDWSAAAGVKDIGHLGPWCLAAAAQKLPGGTYRTSVAPGAAALGWLLAHYRFERYKSAPPAEEPRILLTADPAGIAETVRLAAATELVRDLVNTPAEDMGPDDLADAVLALQKAGAAVSVTRGEALRTAFPAIHAVGRAAAKQPCLIDLTWGDPAHPKVTLVGKGVTFDSGGLDIKPASAMLLMKKDMGGAAHAIALARLVIESGLPVRLRLIVAAVENAISGNAFRPGDVLATRNGMTVEVGNTDAEGRLILCDALTLAQEDDPALLLDFATLTGAARVALGPELPAMFSNDDALAAEIEAASRVAHDPLWRLPLWAGYRDMLKSDVADTGNASDSAFAGAIAAALFLEKFVRPQTPWAHLDLFAWMPTGKPGRPKGGESMTLRAVWTVLRDRYAR
jgi:leucyl aminopeptidase